MCNYKLDVATFTFVRVLTVKYQTTQKGDSLEDPLRMYKMITFPQDYTIYSAYKKKNWQSQMSYFTSDSVSPHK